MDTAQLIKALEADAGHRAVVPLNRIWWLALAGALVAAALAFSLLLSPRRDFMLAMETWRFLAKFVYAGVLVATAFLAVRALSRPEGSLRTALPLFAVAPLLLLVAVALELTVLPQAEWGAKWIGRNSRWCMAYIPLIGLAPLALLLIALRQGAPSRPGAAGAAAGLIAGGLGAFFYATHCVDDSPLFVATWYSLAIAVLAVLGALGGRIFARW